MTELSPDSILSHYRILSKIGAGGMGEVFNVHRYRRDYAAAIASLARAEELKDDFEGAKLIKDSFAKDGWQGFLQAATKERKRTKLSPYLIATLYVEMGQHEKAFAALKETDEKRDQFISFLIIDPLLEPIRNDPRYQELLRKVGFPQ